MKAEMSAQYSKFQPGKYLQTNLTKMGHQKPSTVVVTGNPSSCGVMRKNANNNALKN